MEKVHIWGRDNAKARNEAEPRAAESSHTVENLCMVIAAWVQLYPVI